MVRLTSWPSHALMLVLFTGAVSIASATSASAGEVPGALPVPAVVRVPVTYSWSGRATASGATAQGVHFIAQGEAYSPVRTVEERSAALDGIARERYLDAMAKNRLRGEGIPVRLKTARY